MHDKNLIALIISRKLFLIWLFVDLHGNHLSIVHRLLGVTQKSLLWRDDRVSGFENGVIVHCPPSNSHEGKF